MIQNIKKKQKNKKQKKTNKQKKQTKKHSMNEKRIQASSTSSFNLSMLIKLWEYLRNVYAEHTLTLKWILSDALVTEVTFKVSLPPTLFL